MAEQSLPRSDGPQSAPSHIKMDIPRAIDLLEITIGLCEQPMDTTLDPLVVFDALRKSVWRQVYQARDLLRDAPTGIWPSGPEALAMLQRALLEDRAAKLNQGEIQ